MSYFADGPSENHVKQPLLGFNFVAIGLVERAWASRPVSKYSLKSIRLVATVLFFWKRAMEDPTPTVL